MNYETGTCVNCGADHGLHQFETDRCPKNGIETRYAKQEWQDTVFVDSGIKRLQDAAAELLEAVEIIINADLKNSLRNNEIFSLEEHQKIYGAWQKATGNNIKETV